MNSGLGITLTLSLLFLPIATFAQEDTSDVLALEETVIPMSIPSDNKLPWGFVEGSVVSPAEDHEVIIQIYKEHDPVHFAQVPVSDDGTYQYRFRALDVTDGKTTHIFEGDYTVRIYKVVNLDADYLDWYLTSDNGFLKSVLEF